MNKILKIIILGMVINSCAVNNNATKGISGDCNLQTAEEITSKILIKKRAFDQVKIQSINEDSLYITIKYTLKDENAIGGGSEFIIQKSNCSVISFKRYQ